MKSIFPYSFIGWYQKRIMNHDKFTKVQRLGWWGHCQEHRYEVHDTQTLSECKNDGMTRKYWL